MAKTAAKTTVPEEMTDEDLNRCVAVEVLGLSYDPSTGTWRRDFGDAGENSPPECSTDLRAVWGVVEYLRNRFVTIAVDAPEHSRHADKASVRCTLRWHHPNGTKLTEDSTDMRAARAISCALVRLARALRRQGARL